MILDGVVPFVRGTLSIDGDSRDGWLMLDTGAYTSILSSARLSPVSKVVARAARIGRRSRAWPAVSIGGRTFSESQLQRSCVRWGPIGARSRRQRPAETIQSDHRQPPRGRILPAEPAPRWPFRNPEYVPGAVRGGVSDGGHRRSVSGRVAPEASMIDYHAQRQPACVSRFLCLVVALVSAPAAAQPVEQGQQIL